MTHKIEAARGPVIPDLAALVLAVLAAGLALVAGSARSDPVAAAEGSFLAFLATAVLLAFVPAAVRPEPLATPTVQRSTLFLSLTVLVVVATWTLPSGPLRGAVVGLLLALCPLFLCPSRREPGRLDLSFWLPAMVGLQMLLRVQLLMPLEPSPRLAVTLFALPIAAVLVADLLARSRGSAAATTTILALVLASGGFTVNGVLVLTSLLAAERLRLSLGDRRRPAAAIVFLALLVLPLLWDPARGTVIVIGAVLLLLQRAWAAFLLVGAGALLLLAEPRPWSVSLPELVLVALLFPAVWPWLFRDPRTTLSIVGPPILLGGVALRALEPVDGLVMPAALIAVRGLGRDPRARTSELARETLPATLAWLLFLVVSMAASAGYPWLRWPDLEEIASGLAGGQDRVLWLLLVVSLFAALARTFPRGRQPAGLSRAGLLRAGIVGAGLLGAGALLWSALPARHAALLVDWPPVLLETGKPSFSAEIDGAGFPRGACLVVESALLDSSEVAAGSAVLEVSVVPPEGEAQRIQLRLGEDTGEWAAARDGSPAPEPWLSWVAPSRRFFAQRYRSRIDLGPVAAGSRIEIAAAPSLSSPARVTLYRALIEPQRTPR